MPQQTLFFDVLEGAPRSHLLKFHHRWTQPLLGYCCSIPDPDNLPLGLLMLPLEERLILLLERTTWSGIFLRKEIPELLPVRSLACTIYLGG